MLSDSQLEEIKVKLESGRMLKEIIETDYPEEKLMEVRRKLVEKFTQPVISQLLQRSQLSSLTVEELNKRINMIQKRLNHIISISKRFSICI